MYRRVAETPDVHSSRCASGFVPGAPIALWATAYRKTPNAHECYYSSRDPLSDIFPLLTIAAMNRIDTKTVNNAM